MAAFDPYHEWLGIPPQDQPPNHYRLLGIAPLEPNPGVIAGGAKRQMARVKACQAGGDSELAQRVLKEIALARNYLLDPTRKAEYDRQLKPRLQPEKTSPPAVQPGDPIGGTGETRTGGMPATEGSDTRSSADRSRGRAPKRRSQLVSIVLGGIAGTLLALAIIYVIRGREVSVAEQAPPPSAESHSSVSPSRPGAQVPAPEPLAAHAPTPDSEEEEEETAERRDDSDVSGTPEPAEPSESDASADDGESRPGPDQTTDSEPQDGQNAGDTQDVAAALPEPEQAPTQPPSRPKKPPVPDAESQQQAEQKVRELLKSEFDAASTPDQKAALATRLVKLGSETTGDPATRFMLFQLAYELTAAMGDWAKALTIVDTMGEHYQADVLSIKADLLGEVVERVQVTPQTSKSVKEVLNAVSQGFDEAVATDNYGAADRFLRSARVIARKVGNPAMIRELGVREREIGRIERAFDRVKTALEMVAQGSADAAANLEAGRWYCFEKDNWEQGLPLLAKGSDAPLADLARRELTNTDDLQQQIQLAEDWLQAAKNEPGSTASAIVSRAQHWCDQAMPKLDDALTNDDYQTAGRLLTVAVSAAREANDLESVAEFTSRQEEIERLEQQFASIKSSLDVLAGDPDNPEANLTAGRWYCFDKGDWEKGLPLLAKSADPALADLAQRDTAGPKDSSGQLILADDWWSLAEEEKNSTKAAIQSRAVHWYEQALPKLSGLDKVKVEKRLEAAASQTAQAAPGARGGGVEPGNVALANNGTVVDGVEKGARYMLDGNVQHTKPDECATGKWPCEWTITLRTVYRLQEIRMHLRSDDGRYYRYAIATSPDSHNYSVVVDRSQGQWCGWQQVAFSPRPVKTIKLIGLWSKRGPSFHVVEFEAYCIPPKTPPE